MEIDENSLTPLFIQIAEWIESEILSGNIEEGESIPSTNQFASIYGKILRLSERDLIF